jgi:tellurite resistance protein TehA-like permease
VFCWAAATWWVPLLVVLGAWRHLARRVPLRYDHGYWAAVFPVGMYAAATMRAADALGLPFLRPAGEAVAWMAAAAWAVTAAGLARWVVGAVRSG